VNDFDLVRKNLFRRKLRASLMIVSILIAFMIFGVLAGFYRAFTAGEDRAAAARDRAAASRRAGRHPRRRDSRADLGRA